MLVAFVQRWFMQASLSFRYTECCDLLGTACWRASLSLCAMHYVGWTTNLIEALKRLIFFGIKDY